VATVAVVDNGSSCYDPSDPFQLNKEMEASTQLSKRAGRACSMSSTEPQQIAPPSPSPPQRSGGGGAFKAGAFFLVIALLAFGLGALEQSRSAEYDPNEVMCGEDVMSPGDVCLAYGDGGGDYDEMRAQHEASHQTSLRIASIGPMVGIGAAALAVLLFVVGFAKLSRRRTSSTVAP
jgi:hypothetical protein